MNAPCLVFDSFMGIFRVLMTIYCGINEVALQVSINGDSLISTTRSGGIKEKSTVDTFIEESFRLK